MNCYMCGKEATSNEHVPPKCLFPEQKDLHTGVDLRKQLITVPSCDEHNSAKSQDDEYLLQVLAINLPANVIAKNQFLTKIMRSINRNPRLVDQIMKHPQTVITVGKNTAETHHTIAVKIDDARFDSALEHIGRALYFHHFREKWLGDIRTQPDFLLRSLNPSYAEALNKPVENIAKAADQAFKDSPYFGENPDVFKYQVVNGNKRAKILMRLHFYIGCRVTVFFLNHSPGDKV